ncbi:hypothetical protein FRC10_009536 [Ceratobasidium sp. 414]|nr:hypothetical protein FRC10_009536 [Ceratobasidium sp. 414]
MNTLKYEDGPLVWVDLETSGLDPAKTRIMEIAVLITNGDLELVDEEGCQFVVKLNEQTMVEMDDWCKKQHKLVRSVTFLLLRSIDLSYFRWSGLIAKADEATKTAPEVADAALEYIKRWVPKPRTAQLAGSSVHFDAIFLRATGPDVAENGGGLIWKKVVDHLQHSSVKEICRRWYPKVYKHYGSQLQSASNHRALEDLKQSIASSYIPMGELKFYRETIFVNPEVVGDAAETKKRKIE